MVFFAVIIWIGSVPDAEGRWRDRPAKGRRGRCTLLSQGLALMSGVH